MWIIIINLVVLSSCSKRFLNLKSSENNSHFLMLCTEVWKLAIPMLNSLYLVARCDFIVSVTFWGGLGKFSFALCPGLHWVVTLLSHRPVPNTKHCSNAWTPSVRSSPESPTGSTTRTLGSTTMTLRTWSHPGHDHGSAAMIQEVPPWSWRGLPWPQEHHHKESNHSKSWASWVQISYHCAISQSPCPNFVCKIGILDHAVWIIHGIYLSIFFRSYEGTHLYSGFRCLALSGRNCSDSPQWPLLAAKGPLATSHLPGEGTWFTIVRDLALTDPPTLSNLFFDCW